MAPNRIAALALCLVLAGPASALAQEGKRKEAAAVYEEILESTDIIDSQIVRRSREILAQNRN